MSEPQQHSLIEDLSVLTTIPQSSLNQLADKSVYCICDCIEESVLNESYQTSVRLGIGTLIVEVDDNEVYYRFEPSKELEENVTKTIIDQKNPLVEKAEETLVKRILNTYKDFL